MQNLLVEPIAPRLDLLFALKNSLAASHYLHADDFGAWNALWAEYFPAPRPVRTTIVTGFAVPGMLIEVEVTAGIPA